MANTASPSVHRHRNIGRYLALTIRHPQEALAELVADSRGRVFATLALGTVAVLYSLTEWSCTSSTTTRSRRRSCALRPSTTTRGRLCLVFLPS